MSVLEHQPMQTANQYDIKELLLRYGIWDKFTNGTITCHVCGEPISYSNLGLTLENEREMKVRFVCNRRSCINSYFRGRLG